MKKIIAKSTKVILFSISFLSLLNSCSVKDEKSALKVDNTVTETRLRELNPILDSTFLNLETSSYHGSILYLKDSICFIDKRFCKIYFCNYSGQLLSKKFNQGTGINNIDTKEIRQLVKLKDGTWGIIGVSNDFSIHDNKLGLRKLSTLIDWKGTLPYGQARLLKSFTPSEPIIYSFESGESHCRVWNNKIYLPIYCEHKDFNGLVSRVYYEEGRILAELDVSSNKNIHISRILGRRTDKLLDYKFLPHHSFFDFDISSNGEFYVAHEIDPIIYVYDNNFNLLRSFGVEGGQMNTSYTELQKFNVIKYRELLKLDRPKKGYYKSIKVFDNGHIVFRSYARGAESNSDILQVYVDNVLINEINIPVNLSIEYCKNGIYYSNVFLDDESEQAMIYSLKLTKL